MSKKVTINVSEKELNALEDILMAWNLCKKHKAIDSEIEMAVRIVDCKACVKETRKVRSLAMNIEGRLWTEFLKDEDDAHKKRFNEKFKVADPDKEVK